MARSLSPLALGPLTINTVDADGTEWLVRSFDGWEGSPESSVAVVRKPRQAGAWTGQGYTVERVMAIGGLITARTPELSKAAARSLKGAVTNSEFRLEVFEPGDAGWCMAKKQGETIVKRITSLVVQFSVQVVAEDPRKFSSPLTALTRLPSTSGGLSVPFTVPVSIAATTVSGQVSLTNSGNESGPVVLRIDGPCVGPVVTHVGSGLSLVFASSLVLNAGEWLDIDMEARQVLANGQSSRNGYVTSRGWFSFVPGVNSWAFTAASFTAGALLTVIATPADQ